MEKANDKTWHEQMMADFNEKFTYLYQDRNGRVLRLMQGDYKDIAKWIESYGKGLTELVVRESAVIKPVIAKAMRKERA